MPERSWRFALLERDWQGKYRKLAMADGYASREAARQALVQLRQKLLPPPA